MSFVAAHRLLGSVLQASRTRFQGVRRIAASCPQGERSYVPPLSRTVPTSGRAAFAASRSMVVWEATYVARSQKRQSPWHAPLNERTQPRPSDCTRNDCAPNVARPTARPQGSSTGRWPSSTSPQGASSTSPAASTSRSRPTMRATPSPSSLGATQSDRGHEADHTSFPFLESGNDHVVPLSFHVGKSYDGSQKERKYLQTDR